MSARSSLGLVVLLAAGVAAYLWWSSDERRIRSTLHELAGTLSVPPGSDGLSQVARVAGLRHYFDPDVRIQVGGQELRSRDTLLALLGRAAPAAEGFTVEFGDISVIVSETGQEADVSLTARVTGRDPVTGDRSVDGREADVTMVRREGDWVILRVEDVPAIARPGEDAR